MISDSFFEQGVTHEVCEDYALHGDQFAVVSDGCSNGGGPRIDTDWGSRLLCKLAEEHIETMEKPVFLPVISSRAQMLIRLFPKLSPACLTATLMVLKVVGDNFQARVVGDGVVGGKRKDGRWKIHVIDCHSAPYYLKYNIFNEQQVYFDNFSDSFVVRNYFGHLMSPEKEPPAQPIIEERKAVWAADFSITEREHKVHTENPALVFDFPLEEYEFAFVCSDGVESFYQHQITNSKKSNEPIFVLDILRVLLDFVTVRPGFARLQRHWAFRQDKAGTFVRRGWKNGDDVSVGVVYG